jgi:hypothetical protein
MAATVTAAVPEPATARIHLTVSWAGYNRARVYRYESGQPARPLRNVYTAEGEILPPPYDYEAPLGVQVGYAATGWNDPAVEPAAPAQAQIYTTLLVPDTSGWLTDPGRPSLNLPLACITVLPTKTYEPNVGLFRPLGRARAVSIHSVRSDWTGDLEWITSTYTEETRFEYIFASGGILLLRTGSAYGFINEYVQPMSVAVAPLEAQSLPNRKWRMPMVVTDSPVGDRPIETGGTYQDLKEDYLTYADTKAHYRTYYDLLRYT